MEDTKPKAFVFVLMPFADKFTDIYEVGIKQACKDAGAYCERVDEQIFNERILDRIYNQIAKADLVVADMTGRNANVFYEVGYAHALGKLTILLTQNASDIPFDLKHFPHIVYGAKISVLKDELEKRVEFFIKNPPSKSSDIKLGLELFLEGKNLASGEAEYRYALQDGPSPPITVFNDSGVTFAPGDFKVGILTSETYQRCDNRNVASTKLPDGRFLHMLPNFPALFPNAYCSFAPVLETAYGKLEKPGQQEVMTVRLFTKQGSWDYPVTIICNQ